MTLTMREAHRHADRILDLVRSGVQRAGQRPGGAVLEPLPQRVPTRPGQGLRARLRRPRGARGTPRAPRRRDRLRALRDDHAVPAARRRRGGGGADRHRWCHRAHGFVARVRRRGRPVGPARGRHVERGGGRHQRDGHLPRCRHPGVGAARRPLLQPVHAAHLLGGAGVRPVGRDRRRARRHQPLQPHAAASARAAGHDGPHDREPPDRRALPQRPPAALPQPAGVRLHAARGQARRR